MPKHVLLLCGGGASSSFMAQSIRKAAKKQGIEIDVEAKSDSAIDDYWDVTNLILLGPHLKYMLEDMQALGEEHNIPIHIIPDAVYGVLDGEKALKLILDIFEEQV